jgi:hypothetical protein
MREGSRTVSRDNCRIDPFYEAAAAALPAQILVFALLEDDSARQYARTISSANRSRRPEQYRLAQARRYARWYVPRGPDAFEAITNLLLRMAGRYEEARKAGATQREMRFSVSSALLTPAGFSYTEGGAVTRERRVKANSMERMHKAAAMVVARGAGRCMNLQCGAPTTSGSYCPPCEADPEVERDHNQRLKAIEALWKAATPYLARQAFQANPPAPASIGPVWPREKREAWLKLRAAR